MSRCRPSATKLNLFKRGWLGHGFADLISSVIASQVEGLEEEDGYVCVCVCVRGWGGIERGRRGQTEREGECRRRVKKEFLNSFIPRGSHFKRNPADRNFRFKPGLPLSLFLFL